MSEELPHASKPHHSPVITIRAPTVGGGTTSGSIRGSSTFTPPPLPWLIGTWHVTHSTLPMWKKARNVAITYKMLNSDVDPSSGRLDDTVSYQSLSAETVKIISGIDTPAGPGAWNWRGRGWLMIASSHWEVLGYGGEEEEVERWVVTYFAKTLFTPAGIDIYSRRQEGLKEGTVEAIKQALGKVDAEVLRRLAGELFAVKID